MSSFEEVLMDLKVLKGRKIKKNYRNVRRKTVFRMFPKSQNICDNYPNTSEDFPNTSEDFPNTSEVVR